MSAAPQAHPRLVELLQQRKLRKKVERVVSRLMAALDEIDADPEAEPPLGWPPLMNQERAMRVRGPEGGHEAEPSLGAPERHRDQLSWGSGSVADLEFGGDTMAQEDAEDGDPGGADVLDEPHDGNLGWHGNMDQSDLGDAQESELDPTDCITRYSNSRDYGKPHAREAERQALALKRRLSGQPAPADTLSNCRPVTTEEMARMLGRAR